MRCDATSVVERMARRAHAAGVGNPVAASVVLGARISRLSGLEDFARRIGVPAVRLAEAEAGTVRFGELPAELGPVLAGLGLDLLALADLERELAAGPPAV